MHLSCGSVIATSHVYVVCLSSSNIDAFCSSGGRAVLHNSQMQGLIKVLSVFAEPSGPSKRQKRPSTDLHESKPAVTTVKAHKTNQKTGEASASAAQAPNASSAKLDTAEPKPFGAEQVITQAAKPVEAKAPEAAHQAGDASKDPGQVQLEFQLVCACHAFISDETCTWLPGKQCSVLPHDVCIISRSMKALSRPAIADCALSQLMHLVLPVTNLAHSLLPNCCT